MTTTPLPDPALIVTRLRYDFLFCLDPGFWIAPSERNRRLTFTQSVEAERIALALRPDQRVRSVEWAQSVFEDAQRRDHATLTTINFDDIAPANIRLAEPLVERVGMFDLGLSDIRLSLDGPIAFPFVARFAPEGSVHGLPVDRLLRELLVVRESAYRLFHKAARNAFEIVSARVCSDPATSRSSQRRSNAATGSKSSTSTTAYQMTANPPSRRSQRTLRRPLVASWRV